MFKYLLSSLLANMNRSQIHTMLIRSFSKCNYSTSRLKRWFLILYISMLLCVCVCFFFYSFPHSSHLCTQTISIHQWILPWQGRYVGKNFVMSVQYLPCQCSFLMIVPLSKLFQSLEEVIPFHQFCQETALDIVVD